MNLRVTAISPGMVETEFYQVSHFNDKNKIASTPYQNMKCLQAEDIAQVCPVFMPLLLLHCMTEPACSHFRDPRVGSPDVQHWHNITVPML